MSVSVGHDEPVSAMLHRLDLRLKDASTATELAHAGAEVLGEFLEADRAGYALADVTTETVLLEGLWGRAMLGTPSLTFENFGTSALELKNGIECVIGEAPDELRGSGPLLPENPEVRSFMIVPVHERGKVVAFLFAQSGRPKAWAGDHLAAARAVAERVRYAQAQARIDGRRRASDQQMMAIADSMPIHVFAADNYGMLYWHNRRVYEFTGASASDFDGFGFQDFIHPDDLESALRNWYEGLATGAGHSTEFRTRRADGEYRWFVCRSEPMFDEDGRIVRYLGTSTDIHDLKCAQNELARLNHDLEAEVADRTQERDLQWKTSSDLMAVTAPRLESFRVNPAWEKMLGWSHSEMLALDGAAFIHPDDRAPTFGWLGELTADGDRVEFENRLLRKDGGHVWLSWIVTRHGGKNYSTGRDITMTRSLIAAQQDLAHASRVATLGELTASIAHEVSQPLAAVTANAQAARRWLTRMALSVPEALAALDRVVSENRRAGEIIMRIRDMAVRGKIVRTRVAVGQIISDSVAIVQSQIRTLGAVISVSADGAIPDVLGDRVQLQQVLTNLLLNAAQAMSRAESPVRSIVVSADVVGSKVLIRVADTGPGVSQEAASRVFDAFFTTRADGMGMGLAIAKYIVEANGGELILKTNGERGAAFQIGLPLYEGDSAKVEELDY